MLALIGTKKSQSQKFLENGKRIPVTLIDVKDNTVISVKTQDKNNYQAVQLGFSMKKKASKAEIGHAKGAKLEKAPKFLKEVRIIDESEALPEIGSILNPSEVFAPGDIVDVTGISKGKGFAGVVKRHGFHGGPKTHGQSDRHRAPGAIGQGTTPGRVYRGKRMAGRMGSENVTIQNLLIIKVTDDGVLVIKGLVPGVINGPIMVKKVGEDKKFVPLYRTPEEIAAEEILRQSQDKEAGLEEETLVLRDAQDADATATAKEAEEVDKTAKEAKEDAPAEETSKEEQVEEVKTEPEEKVEEAKEEEEENAKQ